MMTLDQKKAVVARFLRRCNEYAEREIARYRLALDDADAARALELQDKICHWSAYRAFNAYALTELEGTELDAWFDE